MQQPSQSNHQAIHLARQPNRIDSPPINKLSTPLLSIHSSFLSHRNIKMPSQPTEASTSSPLHLLQSCLFASESSKDAVRCLSDESPIHCLWDVVQSRIASNSALSVSRTTSSSSSSSAVSRSELVSAHDSLRQDFNLSSLIWNSDTSSFRR
jgi:hypothetical protein